MNSFRSHKSDWRLTLVFLGFGIICSIFLVRLFVIQILDHDKYRAQAQDQYWMEQILPAKRGDILTKDFYPLATSQLSYLLYVEPKNIHDKELYARTLSETISEFYKAPSNSLTEDLSKSKIVYKEELYQKYKRMLSRDLYWIGLEKNLDPEQKAKIEELKLKFIGFEEEPLRYYPEKMLAAPVLGFVASDERGNRKGYEGIEGYFDGDLRGKPGKIVEEKDAFGEPILIGGHKKILPINGRNIVLTIDRAIQYKVEQRLKQAVEEYDAKSGVVIVMDPSTGDVLAMANYPTYDPSDFSVVSTPDDVDVHRKESERKNLSIAENYEPGSVIKALTIATGIDIGKITPDSTFVDDGPVLYSGKTINNWNYKHYGTQNMVELLQKSNNIGAAYVGHLIGSNDLLAYFRKFGLGEKSDIDLQGEEKGLLREPKNLPDIDLANYSFGQGLFATPLQVLNSFNVIANGGVLMKPRIVSNIVDNGKEIIIPVKEIRRVISKETSNTVSDMLLKTVDGGEGRYFNLKTYKISGKTGTAQININGEYDAKKTNATFVGYLNVSKKFSMIVKLNTPLKSTYASETSVPLFMRITDDLAKYFGIPPDRTPSEVDSITSQPVTTLEEGTNQDAN